MNDEPKCNILLSMLEVSECWALIFADIICELRQSLNE